jgi:hypothetical protein
MKNELAGTILRMEIKIHLRWLYEVLYEIPPHMYVHIGYVCMYITSQEVLYTYYEICILLKNTGISVFGNSKLCMYYE